MICPSIFLSKLVQLQTFSGLNRLWVWHSVERHFSGRNCDPLRLQHVSGPRASAATGRGGILPCGLPLGDVLLVRRVLSLLSVQTLHCHEISQPNRYGCLSGLKVVLSFREIWGCLLTGFPNYSGQNTFSRQIEGEMSLRLFRRWLCLARIS